MQLMVRFAHPVDLLLFETVSDLFMRFKPRQLTSFMEKDPGVTLV